VRALAKCAGKVQLHVLPSLAVGVSQRRVQRCLALVFQVSVGTPGDCANDVARYFDNGRLVDLNRFKNEIGICRSLRRASTFPVGFIVRCHALKLRHNHDVHVTITRTASNPAVLASRQREGVFAFLEGHRMVHCQVDPLACRVFRQSVVSDSVVESQVQVSPSALLVGNDVSGRVHNGILGQRDAFRESQVGSRATTRDAKLVHGHTRKFRDNHDVQVAPGGSTSERVRSAACNGESRRALFD